MDMEDVQNEGKRLQEVCDFRRKEVMLSTRDMLHMQQHIQGLQMHCHRSMRSSKREKQKKPRAANLTHKTKS